MTSRTYTHTDSGFAMPVSQNSENLAGVSFGGEADARRIPSQPPRSEGEQQPGAHFHFDGRHHDDTRDHIRAKLSQMSCLGCRRMITISLLCSECA